MAGNEFIAFGAANWTERNDKKGQRFLISAQLYRRSPQRSGRSPALRYPLREGHHSAPRSSKHSPRPITAPTWNIRAIPTKSAKPISPLASVNP